MNKPHKHAVVIKAWADGAEVEWFDTRTNRWIPIRDTPMWFEHGEYRIKPIPKPDVVIEAVMFSWNNCQNVSLNTLHYGKPNVKITLDGETGMVKNVEVLNKC